MTERSLGKAGGSNVPQTKEDIARKIADRHPEVSKKNLMTQSLAVLRRILLSGKIPAMLSESGYYKMPTPTTKLGNKTGGVIRRRGGGIAKRGMGIAK